MILSIFLGNKGLKYERTRHNLAWMMLERLSFYNSLNWNKKFKAEWAKHPASDPLIMLKPQTLMNNSGESAASAASFFKLKPKDIIVVHDDLELPFGTVQLKQGGGAGGHNGLRSIIKLCGSSDFFRLRMGISRPPGGRDPSSWVLSRFSPDEEALLDDYCRGSADIFESSVSSGLSAGAKIKVV